MRIVRWTREDLEVNEGIDATELADLLDDETETLSQPCTESEGDELSVHDGDERTWMTKINSRAKIFFSAMVMMFKNSS